VVSCSRDAWNGARGGAPSLSPVQEAALAEGVISTERCVMYTLEFDIGVVHPYAYISQHLKRWKSAGVFEPGWPRSAKNCDAPREIEEALALSNNLAFQTFTQGLHLRFSPQDLAAAALSLAFDILFARRAGWGPDGASGSSSSSSSSSSGGGGGGISLPFASGAGSGGSALQGVPMSPIRPPHFALCAGVSSLEAIMELRAAIPACLAWFVVGDSAVRHFKGLKGGVAPTPTMHSLGTPGGGVGTGPLSGAKRPYPSPPSAAAAVAAAAAAAAAAGNSGLGLAGDDAEEAPQLATLSSDP